MSGPQHRPQHAPYPQTYQYSDPYAQHAYPQPYPYYAPAYPQQGQFPAYGARPAPYQHEYGIHGLDQQMAAAHIDAGRHASHPQQWSTEPRPASSQPYHGTPDASQASAERRSSISLRYPPLPEIPPRGPSPVPTDANVRQYIDSLKAVIRAHEQRDELLRLRTEAVGFEPKVAWLAWNDPTLATESVQTGTHPILGVRLLQKVDQLTRENEELGQALEQQIDQRSATGEQADLASARSEIADCHRLIASLDQALTKAELRASAADRALQVACASNSTSITASSPADVEQPAANGSASPTSSAKKAPPVRSQSSPNTGRARNRGPPANLPSNPRPPRRPPAHTSA